MFARGLSCLRCGLNDGVSDNGMDSSQPTADNARIDFLDQHLRALHRAIADGCRVTCYHAWSLMDNFEWTAGYRQRWGLVRVDSDTLSRTPKNSRLLVRDCRRKQRTGGPVGPRPDKLAAEELVQ
jgi:beta-glucosidase